MSETQSPPGWYPDPTGDTTKQRYWDGNQWTDQFMNVAPSVPSMPSAPSAPSMPSVSSAVASTDASFAPNAAPGASFTTGVPMQTGSPTYGSSAPYAAPGAPVAYQTQESPENAKNRNFAVVSLVLGLVGIFSWCLPIAGFPISVIGLIMGINGRKSNRKGMATAGIVLCSIFLFLTIVKTVLGMFLSLGYFDVGPY
ncbi:MAG: DUF2510 domain-containing protein [Coriobacteriales bacterium]|nr:DUF2510 domain-containing protein [Coriobacteriales bacterium]